MSFNSLFPDIEPRDGDFIAYLEQRVGPPPSQDPESMAQVVVSNLTEQSHRNIEAGQSMQSPAEPVAGPLAAGATPVPAGADGRTARPRTAARQSGDALPDIAGAVGSAVEAIGALVRRVVMAIGGLLIALGIGLVALALVASEAAGGLEPAPGIVLAVIGFVLRSFVARKGKPRSAGVKRRA